VLGDEFLVAVFVVETDADHFNIIFGQLGHAVAEATRLDGATLGIVLGVEVKEDGMLLEMIGQVPRFPLLIFPGDDWRFVTDFGHVGREARGNGEAGTERSGQQWNGPDTIDFHNDLWFELSSL